MCSLLFHYISTSVEKLHFSEKGFRLVGRIALSGVTSASSALPLGHFGILVGLLKASKLQGN